MPQTHHETLQIWFLFVFSSPAATYFWILLTYAYVYVSTIDKWRYLITMSRFEAIDIYLSITLKFNRSCKISDRSYDRKDTHQTKSGMNY